MKKNVFLYVGMLVILLSFVGTTVFAQQNDRWFTTVSNRALSSSQKAYDLARKNVDENIKEIKQLVNSATSDLIEIERLVNSGHKLSDSQQAKFQSINANITAIQRLLVLNGYY